MVLTIVIYIHVLFFSLNRKKQGSKKHTENPNKQQDILLITMFLSGIAMLFFNVYLQAAETLNTFGSTRYFYFPSLPIAIIWGIFLARLVSKQKKLLNAYIFIFGVVWLIYNSNHIQRRLGLEQWIHDANKQTLEILRSWEPETKGKPSYIYLPASIGAYGGEFVSYFFSHRDGKVDVEGLEPLDLNKLAKSGLPPENLFVMHFDPESKNVIDITEDSREKLVNLRKVK